MNGADAWEWVRGRLQVGTMVRNWTAANGYIGRGDFSITEVGPDYVEVDLGGTNRRPVRADDFRKVGEFWTAYCAGQLPRHELRDRPNMNTKYVISILHHTEFR